MSTPDATAPAPSPAPAPRRTDDGPSVRAVLRVVATVVASAVAIGAVYILREPILWVFLAMFLAIALSGPVNVLSRWLPRGLSIALVYLGLFLVPVILSLLIIPPVVNGVVDLVDDLPGYVQDIEKTFNENEQLRSLNEDYDITGKLADVASDLSSRLDDAAGALADIGGTLVSSAFALFTIIVLSVFMVARGRRWIEAALSWRSGPHMDAARRALDRIGHAVGNYIIGAVVQAMLAGIAAFIILTILDVPFASALAVLVAIFDLIPLIGATIAAVLVALVTLFTDFPTATIVWVLFAIAYQQVENYLIQPQIQKRAVALDSFLVIIAVLIGGRLLGVVGAVLAIPVAATLQIAIQEFVAFRRQVREARDTAPAGQEPTSDAEAAPG